MSDARRSPDHGKYLRDIRIHTEYSQLAASRIGGLYVLPDPEDYLTFHGVVFPRQAMYAGGVFKFKITLPPSYPTAPPTVTFLTPVFSPFVDSEVGFSAGLCASPRAPCVTVPSAERPPIPTTRHCCVWACRRAKWRQGPQRRFAQPQSASSPSSSLTWTRCRRRRW